jgi:multidrug efflux pump subunit AcrA (membrane-fusion protein)
MRFTKIVFAAAACVAAVSALSCGATDKSASKAEDYAIPVAVEKVGKGTARDIVPATANIAPEALVTLFSNVPGAVTKIMVKEGDRVKKGQVVAYIDKEKAALQEKQALAGLDMARAQLANMEANRKRLEGLYKENAIPKKLWDDIEAGYLAAKEPAQRRQHHRYHGRGRGQEAHRSRRGRHFGPDDEGGTDSQHRRGGQGQGADWHQRKGHFKG